MLVTHSTKAPAVGESNNAGPGAERRESAPDAAAILQLFFKNTHF